jgi:hypothetical protein
MAVLLGGFLAIQLVPYGRDHDNPPVTAEPSWDSALTRDLTVRACYDCHSNETVWPWYSAVAPASWIVQWDVDTARSHFNVSEWGRDENHGEEAADMVRSGEMPPWYYLAAHPEAWLTEKEWESLASGLETTLGGEGTDDGHPAGGHRHDHRD